MGIFEQGEVFNFQLPTDEIYLDNNAYTKLLSLWVENPLKEIREWNEFGHVWPESVPRDILQAKTIPLPSFSLYLTGIYNKEIVICTDNESYDKVLGITGTGLRIWYKITPDGWKILPEFDDKLNHNYQFYQEHESLRKEVCLTILACWYGIQIALLNPQLQMLFQNPIKEKTYTRTGIGKARKRVVHYIRKHYITEKDIDDAIHGKEHKNFDRKTMAWYVIGHWRQYKNGTRKFINGYWKGPLRDMKRNFDDGRTRLISN